jgi:hypothetical protein
MACTDPLLKYKIHKYLKMKRKIEHADRTSRETLEEQLKKTPSNARRFVQGSSLVC